MKNLSEKDLKLKLTKEFHNWYKSQFIDEPSDGEFYAWVSAGQIYEEKLAILKQKLELTMNCIEFYSDIDNWGSTLTTNMDVINEVDVEEIGVFEIGGKFARETKKQIEEMK